MISDGPVRRLWQKISPFQEHTTISNTDTIIHLLKGNIGTGILAMPDAIKNSGLIVGNLGLVFLSVVCIHCMHILISIATEIRQMALDKSLAVTAESRRTSPPTEQAGEMVGEHNMADDERLMEHSGEQMILTYPDIVHEVCQTSRSSIIRYLSVAARNTINLFLCLTQFGFCCVYVVFVSKNVKLVIDHHFGHIDYHWYMMALFPLVLMLAQIRDLRYLSPISMLANVLQFFGLAVCFYYLIQDLPPTSSRKLVADWHQLPLYFGTAVYAFEGIGVVLPIVNQMRTPNAMGGWNGVLNTAMSLVSISYVAVAFFGYLKYGEDVKGAVTLNLPVGEMWAQASVLGMSMSIFLSYALQFYVAMELVVPSVKTALAPNMSANYAEMLVRSVSVALTFGLAATIPRLDLAISLVGALASSALSLIIPPLIDLIFYWDSRKGEAVWIVKNLAILIIGCLGLVTGTYYSVRNVYEYIIE